MAIKTRRIWTGGQFSGLQLDLTRKGIYLSGWYDSMVGIEGVLIPWEDFDRLREQVFRRGSDMEGSLKIRRPSEVTR